LAASLALRWRSLGVISGVRSVVRSLASVVTEMGADVERALAHFWRLYGGKESGLLLVATPSKTFVISFARMLGVYIHRPIAGGDFHRVIVIEG
jgi:hypothetical protein